MAKSLPILRSLYVASGYKKVTNAVNRNEMTVTDIRVMMHHS